MQTWPQSIERIPPGRNGWPSRRNMIAWLGRLGIDFHHLKALGWNISIPRSKICQCRRYLMEKDLCQECQDLKFEKIVSNNNMFFLLERHVLKQTLHEWCTDLHTAWRSIYDQRWMNHLPGNDGAKVARSPRWQRKGGETWEAEKGRGEWVMRECSCSEDIEDNLCCG